jgi:hAT family C-terminal dimerisation region
MTEGRNTTLADHFQAHYWLLNEIDLARQKFEELHHDAKRHRRRNNQEADDYAWLAAAAEVSWNKCWEYFEKADQTAAYYTAISLDPTLKHEWYKQHWSDDEKKQDWIISATNAVKELWLEEYKGKYSGNQLGVSNGIPISKVGPLKEKSFTSFRSIKRLKVNHQTSDPEPPIVDSLDQFIETDVIPLGEDEVFDPIQYWNDRYTSQPDLARMALDALAVSAMSDECERLFSSAKILLNDRRSRLKMDIIEASECLRAWYGKPKRKTFDDTDIGLMEGEPPAKKDGDGNEIFNEEDNAVDAEGIEDIEDTGDEH